RTPPSSQLLPYTTLFRSRDFGPSDSGVYVSSSSEGVVLDGLTVINTGLRAVQVAGAGAVTLRVSSARLVAPPGGGDYGIDAGYIDRKSTRLNSSHVSISY